MTLAFLLKENPMKLISKLVAVGLGLSSLPALSAVDVQIQREIAPVIINGESLGFTLQKRSVLELDDGLNQVVVRIEQLVQNSLGEREKFNSTPVVVTFDESNVDLELTIPKRFSTIAKAEQFNENPQFLLTNKKTGKVVKTTQDILPNGGGITRDYEKETARYNSKNGILLNGVQPVMVAAAVSAPQSVEVAKALPVESKSTEMVKYWFGEATPQDQEKFAQLAFSHRNSEINLSENNSSQSLQMMTYWFNEAERSDKKNIVAWIINNE